jgi:hypothetical protein
VSPGTVRRFESGAGSRPYTVDRLQGVLENAGIVFIGANEGGPGVRLRKETGAPG